MRQLDSLYTTTELCSIPNANGYTYTLLDDNALPCEDRYIVITAPDGISRIRGLFESITGNVFICNADEDPRTAVPTPKPAVRIVGDLSGQTGQVTIIQPDGSYRRFSRWDRIANGSPAQPNAIVRTLPQCGCGGSLGMPRLFDSFADMSAYFFCTFALDLSPID